ncbi:CD166 antigen-like [Mustelus asterias]
MAPASALTCTLLLSVCSHVVYLQEDGTLAPQKISAIYGEELQLPCPVPHLNNTEVTQWFLRTSSAEQWEPIGVATGVEALAEGGHFEMLGNWTLRVQSVTVEDEGLFKCQVTRNGLAEVSVISVSVFKRPAKPELIGNGLISTAGILPEIGKCIAKDGYPVGDIAWYKNGKELHPNGNVTQIQVRIMKDQNTRLCTIESTLYYTASKSDMNAMFLCEVAYPDQGGNDKQSSEPIIIEVHYPIQSVTIEVSPSSDEITEGDTITLRCLADTNPEPTEYSWKKDGVSFSSESQLTLPAVTKSVEGEYHCIVFDFDFNRKSAITVIRLRGTEDNNELDGFRVIAEESHSTDYQGQSKSLNRTGMVIGIIVTLMLVAFFTIIAYYMCYYRKKTEKKPLEDVEEKNALDPGIVSAIGEKAVKEEP